MAGASVSCALAHWAAERRTIEAIRRRVFVDEQKIPEKDEFDGEDASCLHVLARLNRDPVGTGRLMPTGKIGRLAVLAASRRHGIGSRMLLRLVELARERGLPEVYLHAQVSALPFYVAHGFAAEGDEFEEAGISHRRMRLVLADHPRAADQRPAAPSAGATEPAGQRG